MMMSRAIGWMRLLLPRTIFADWSKFHHNHIVRNCIPNFSFSFAFSLDHFTKKIMLFTTFSTKVNHASFDAVIAGLGQLGIELIVVYVIFLIIVSTILFEQCFILYLYLSLSLSHIEQRT